MSSCEIGKLGNCVDFAKVCRENGVALCYLFGSQADGYADEKSDVDIGVVFLDAQKDMDWWEQWQRLILVSACFFPLKALGDR